MQLQKERDYFGSSVFEAGNLSVKAIKVKKRDESRPPVELLVMAPEAKGTYPIVLFCHGYCTQTTWYSHLLRHISSHGYILVAPQVTTQIFLLFFLSIEKYNSINFGFR